MARDDFLVDSLPTGSPTERRWTLVPEAASTWVFQQTGVVKTNTSSSRGLMRTGTITPMLTNLQQTVKFKTGTVSNATFRLLSRAATLASNTVDQLSVTLAGSLLRVQKYKNGSASNLATQTLPGSALQTGKRYWLRSKVINNEVSASLWDVEPDTVFQTYSNLLPQGVSEGSDGTGIQRNSSGLVFPFAALPPIESPEGGQALSVQRSASGATQAYVIWYQVPASPGDMISTLARFMCETVVRNARCDIVFRDAENANLGQIVGPQLTPVGTLEWVTLTVHGAVAPAGTVAADIRITILATAINEQFWVDSWSAIKAPTITEPVITTKSLALPVCLIEVSLTDTDIVDHGASQIGYYGIVGSGSDITSWEVNEWKIHEPLLPAMYVGNENENFNHNALVLGHGDGAVDIEDVGEIAYSDVLRGQRLGLDLRTGSLPIERSTPFPWRKRK